MQIISDSKYASLVALQRWRPKTNIKLASRAARLAYLVNTRYETQWSWIRGHSDHYENDLADAAAKRRADGLLNSWQDDTQDAW